MAYAIGIAIAFGCGFVLGLLCTRRGTDTDLSVRAERVDDNLDDLGKIESGIADGVTAVEERLADSITTASGMGEQIQRARDILAGIRDRGKRDNP